MADSSNQKVLREFCAISGCEVWKAIQDMESRSVDLGGAALQRSHIRLHCPERCAAYSFLKFLDGGNFEIHRRRGYGQYHNTRKSRKKKGK